MSEEKNLNEENIFGVIYIIFKPNSVNRGFNDIDDYYFSLKLLNETKETIKCSGKCYPLYEGQRVTLTGHYNAKGVFNFTSIKSQMNSLSSSKEFLEKIISKKALEKIRFNYKDKEIKEAVLNKDKEFFENALDEKQAEKIISKIERHQKLINAIEALSKYGLNVRQIERITKLENFNLIEIEDAIKKNPFQLMRFNINFNSCDIVNASNNGIFRSKNRIYASIYQVFEEIYQAGDTYVPENELQRFYQRAFNMLNFSKELYKVEEWLNITIQEIENCFYELIKSKKVIVDNSYYYLEKYFEMEEFLRTWCKGVIEEKELDTYSQKEIEDYIKTYEKQKGFCLGKEQKQAVVNSLRHKISIITGGAGTGKTSSLATIVSFYLAHGYKEKEIRLSSPTGKASQRMMESINGQLNSNLVATTCHVMLEARGNTIDTFGRNEKNKLEGKVLVIDETSMMDLELAYALIKAVKNDCKIIFLGDIDQLPPVRAGYFLRDMIESNIPCVKLFEIHRQKGDSSIIPISLEIKKEQDFIDESFITKIKSDFYFIRAKRNEKHDEEIDNTNMNWLINKYYAYYQKRFKEEKELNPKTNDSLIREKVLDEMMVVTPFRDATKKKVFNAQTISNKIQSKILGEDKSITRNGYKFQLGSKVIVSKNNNEKHLINGQIGYIRNIDFDERTMTMYSDGEIYVLDSDDINNLLLAYAITVHKSQGSEWKYVIYCCFKEGKEINTRNLAYTAVTRAKKLLMIYGDDTSVFRGTPKNFGTKKRSRLLN